MCSSDLDVVVTETPREGWAVVTEGGESLALDLHIDDDLRRAGLAREVVRTLQEARKAAGLEITDRISVWWQSDDADLTTAILEHGATIADDVLATSFTQEEPGAGATSVGSDLPLTLALAKA